MQINKKLWKKEISYCLLWQLALYPAFLLSGCNGQKQIDSETVKTVKVEEQAHLQDDTVSPACKITIDYSYLAESDAADSIAQRINRTIQAQRFGKRIYPDESGSCCRFF